MNNQSATDIIKASETVNPAPFRQLTPFDKASFTWILRGTWLFKGRLDTDRLRAGLVEILNLYPHLSGRLEWDKGIRMNNAGIPFTISHEDGTLIADVAARSEPADRYSTPMDKKKVKSGTAACMNVKLTSVADGTILGIRCSHLLLDGASFYGMVANWARSCRGKSFEPPVINQSVLQASGSLPKADIIRKAIEKGFVKIDLKTLIVFLQTLLSGSKIQRTRGFYFPETTLKSVKKKAAEAAGVNCSTNEVLSALIIRMCTRLHGQDGTPVPYASINVVNCRERIPSLTRHFAGNASYMVGTPALPANASIGTRVHAIHEALAPFIARPSLPLTELTALAADVAACKALLLPFDAAKAFGSKPTVIYINNFSGLPIYDVDFGTGLPAAVIPHDLSDPVLIWPAHPEKGGVEVYFSGSLARAVNRLAPGDPRLSDMERPENIH